jgi:tryptophanyl-tRNA synthetase
MTTINQDQSKTNEREFNYDKITKDFGANPIDTKILDQLKDLFGHVPFQFRRGLVVSHRGFDEILDNYKNKKPFYLYTGRGPSSKSLHLGHLMPLKLTKLLQDLFDVPLVIQITDDEKFQYRQDKTLEEYSKLGDENIKDILSIGFNMDKTFIFKNTDYIGKLYGLNLKIQNKLTISQIKNTFGVTDADNIGKIAFPTLQMCPCFYDAFPDFIEKGAQCLIPCAIDQDPYFRLVRDIAPKLGYPKPAVLHTKFLPSLKGVNQKMSSSILDTAIYLDDSEKEVKKKINKSFSGGKETKEEHLKYGGDTVVDVSYNILNFILEDDDELKTIETNYKNGTLLTGQLKKITIDKINEVISNYA